MKQLLVILFCSIGISVYAVEYMPMQSAMPSATMQSVNNTGVMSSGSAYTSAVYAVGASGVSSAPSPAAGPRKAPPGGGGGESGYDPNNPQFSPLGDALIPLLLMVMAYATYLLLRRRKSRV